MSTATTPIMTLNNGVQMPALGLGVFQIPPEETTSAVESALAAGYRLIDTAAAYGNEREVGERSASRGSTAPRCSSTTKLWISDYGYDEALVGVRGLPEPARARPRRPVASAPTGPDRVREHDRRLQGARDHARRRSRPRDRRLQLQRTAPREPHARDERRAGGEPGRGASVLHAEGAAGAARPPRHRHGGVVASRRCQRLPARRPGCGEEPAPGPADHVAGNEARQDAGAGDPPLAHRARRRRDPQVGEATPDRGELRRLRLRAQRRRRRAHRRTRDRRTGGPDPESISPASYPFKVEN